MSYLNDDENETVRQTLEQVMKEKGMWKEPKVMHTEIGDFHYFDDDNTDVADGTAIGNNVTIGNNFSQPANNDSLIGQPSSYFQNNNSVGEVNNRPNLGGNNYTISTNTTIGQPNNSAGSNSITALNPINAGYQIGQRIGEFAADTKLAYDYWQKMNQTGNQLVKTFGSGQGADIDNYYHPLLQCELAKISPQSRDNGIALGYAKEYLMDYPKKRLLKHQSHNEIMEDSR